MKIEISEDEVKTISCLMANHALGVRTIQGHPPQASPDSVKARKLDAVVAKIKGRLALIGYDDYASYSMDEDHLLQGILDFIETPESEG